MQTIELKNGVQMPVVGLGTSLRGKPKIESEAFVESIKYAVKLGYRHIDTAKIYNNEHLVGKAIKNCGVSRKELFVATKLYPEDMGYEKTLKAFEKSCKQLQLDYIDLYLIHFPSSPSKKYDIETAKSLRRETWRAMEKLYTDGKCRAIGVSNYEIRHLEEFDSYQDSVVNFPMINQTEFHPYYNNQEVFTYCKKRSLQFEGYSPLGKTNVLSDPVIVDLANKYAKTPAQICIRWSIQNNVIAIPGSTNHERIEENFNVFDFELDEGDMKQIWTLNKDEKVSWDPREVA